MVRVDNTDRETARRIMRHIMGHIDKIGIALHEEVNDESYVLDSTYVAGRRAAALAEGVELMKKWRWFWEDSNQLNQSPATAYTDAEIDAIDPDIRTHEE